MEILKAENSKSRIVKYNKGIYTFIARQRKKYFIWFETCRVVVGKCVNGNDCYNIVKLARHFDWKEAREKNA